MGGHMLRTKIHTANEGGGKLFFMIVFIIKFIVTGLEIYL